MSSPLSLRVKQALPSPYLLAKMGFFFFGVPRNGFGSIDVTQQCNLRCKHCYFFEHNQPEEARSLEGWLRLLDHWKRTRSRLEFPFLQCSWVGGEPLLRQELVEQGRRYFRYNLVVTNGTIPLPDWPEVDWYVSIDGDERVHEEIRRKKGIYRRIKENVAAHGPHRLTISFCITRENAHCIERVVEEWSPLAGGFTFDFYTPLEGQEDPLWVPWADRDRILDRVSALRRRFPDKFEFPDRVLRLMRSDLAPKVTRDCLYAKKAFAYDALGRPKEKCMMGARADCSRCGCIVPFYLRSLTDRRLIATDLLSETSLGLRRIVGRA